MIKYTLYGQFVDETGNLIGQNFVIVSNPDLDEPCIAFDKNNQRYLIIANNGYTCMFLDSHGLIIDGFFSLEEHIGDIQAVTYNSNSKQFLVITKEYSSGYARIVEHYLDQNGNITGIDNIIFNDDDVEYGNFRLLYNDYNDTFLFTMYKYSEVDESIQNTGLIQFVQTCETCELFREFHISTNSGSSNVYFNDHIGSYIIIYDKWDSDLGSIVGVFGKIFDLDGNSISSEFLIDSDGFLNVY